MTKAVSLAEFYKLGLMCIYEARQTESFLMNMEVVHWDDSAVCCLAQVKNHQLYFPSCINMHENYVALTNWSVGISSLCKPLLVMVHSCFLYCSSTCSSESTFMASSMQGNSLFSRIPQLFCTVNN